MSTSNFIEEITKVNNDKNNYDSGLTNHIEINRNEVLLNNETSFTPAKETITVPKKKFNDPRLAHSEAIKTKMLSDFEDFLTKQYGRCVKVVPYDDSTSAHNFSIACEVAGENEGDNPVWIKVDVSVPRGSRSSSSDGYDGDEMAQRLADNIEAFKNRPKRTRRKKKESVKADEE